MYSMQMKIRNAYLIPFTKFSEKSVGSAALHHKLFVPKRLLAMCHHSEDSN
jgi:hypothetical protein